MEVFYLINDLFYIKCVAFFFNQVKIRLYLKIKTFTLLTRI